MGTKSFKKISLICMAIISFSCDPSMKTSYIVENKTSQDFLIKLYESDLNSPILLNNDSDSKTEIYGADLAGNPGFFGEVARFDSIEMSYEKDNEIITFYWTKPEGRGCIIPENGIGQVRDDVPLDIYNRDNWELTISGDDESWIFTINEEDLELFE